MSRYSGICPECEDYRDLVYAAESGSFSCIECGHILYDEDGILDAEEYEYNRDIYRGSKLAGLVPDPDWD